jgi:release factor glutamine methyltransferase
MAKSAARYLIESFTEPLYKLYSSSLRSWEYGSLQLLVMPGVFHPGWFVTSRMLLDKLERLDVRDKTVLELGCGTGAQACRAAELGARAYASDVTPAACKNAAINAERNGLQLGVIASDIFDAIPSELLFDFILVNPPFVPSYPEQESDFAFCCGEGYEYYISLFKDLHKVLKPQGVVLMALAKSCNINDILAVADAEGLHYERIDALRRWAETNYLYEIRLNSPGS